MDQPITFTAQDVVNVFLAFCGAIITITAAAAALTKIIAQIRKPKKTQDERIKTLENDVKDIKERLDKGNKRFDEDSDHIDEVEKKMEITNKIIIKSLQALTAHAIDGNNIDKLEEAKKSLDDYLLDQISKRD